MRIKSLICWDIKTQIKYGFYLLYAILTLLYILVLFAVPETWRETLAVILIFSDPAAMGMFFMGAIVLLEKSQRVPCAFAVSPVSSGEYVAAKMISLCVISVLVSGILAAASGIHPIGYVLAGTALSSLIFTLLGIIVAANIGSLNQFVLMTIPFEIICFVPAGLQVFGEILPFFRFYPLPSKTSVLHQNLPFYSTPATGY